MKQLWSKYLTKMDALTLRERLYVFAAVAGITLYLVFVVVLAPAYKRESVLVAQVKQQQADMPTQQSRVQQLENQLKNGDAAGIAQRDQLKHEIADIDLGLSTMQHSLVPAQNMKVLLQDMLARSPRLQLVSMRTMPVAPLVENHKPGDTPAGRDQATQEGGVFKHGVEITLQGNYADLQDYLARLETLPWHMFWSRAMLDASDYPRLKMTVTIYTLSLDKAWLTV